MRYARRYTITILICAPTYRIDDDVVVMRAAMTEASHAASDGSERRTYAYVVRYRYRYMGNRGTAMLDRVMRSLARCEIIRAVG